LRRLSFVQSRYRRKSSVVRPPRRESMSRLTPSGCVEVWPAGPSHARRKETNQARPTKLDGVSDKPTNRNQSGSEGLVARSLSAWRFGLGSHASLTGLRLHERPSSGRELKTPEFVGTASPGVPRRNGGTRRAFPGFIPPPRFPLPLVPLGAALRAPGALPKPKRMSRLLRGPQRPVSLRTPGARPSR
jgi:hypothetical protein